MGVIVYFRMLWQFSRWRSALLLVLLLLSSVTQGVGLFLLVPLIDVIQGTGAKAHPLAGKLAAALGSAGLPITLAGLLSLFVALTAARTFIVFHYTIRAERLRLELLDHLRARSFDALLDAGWAWHVTRRKSDMSNLLMTEISRLGVALTVSLRLPVTAFAIIAYACVAVALSIPMTLAAMVLGGALFLAMAHQHRLARAHGRALTEANQQVQQTVEEGLTAIKLIKILGAEMRQSGRMRTHRDQLRDRTLAFGKLIAMRAALVQVSVALAMVAIIYLGAVVIALPLTTLLVMVVLFARLAPLVQEFQTQVTQIAHADAALGNYRDTLQRAGEQSEMALHRPPAPAPDTGVPFRHAIALVDVSYSYPTREGTSLDRVSLSIPHGTTTAIMGPSGAGKSTLADIVMGLLQPDSGTVTIDGVPLDESNRIAWRRSIAYMPQDVFLFHDTIRNNLLWARADASDSELETALRQAAAGFVFALPEGLDTVVGDSGHRLSGGERQRIALARAILQRPQLMILDEATSALDLENEALICRTIAELDDDLTIIILGHRQSVLGFADQLIVLEDGQVKHAQPSASVAGCERGGPAVHGRSCEADPSRKDEVGRT